MTSWVKTILEKQFCQFRKLHHFNVLQPVNPGKDNIDEISP